MSNSLLQIVGQLRASKLEHVRACVEPDDVLVLLGYFESHGYLAEDAIAALEAEAAAGQGVYFDFLKNRKLTPRQAKELSDADAVALRNDYSAYLLTPEGIKVKGEEKAAKEKADHDAALAAKAAEDKAAADKAAEEDKQAAANAAAAKTAEAENAKVAAAAAAAEKKADKEIKK